MTTNRHGQHLDTKGHVVPETEKVEAAIRLLVPHYKNPDGSMLVWNADKVFKDITHHYIAYQEKDWYAGYRRAVIDERKSVAVMLEALIQSDTHIGVRARREISKIVTALKENK